jgi:hypothetical protein
MSEMQLGVVKPQYIQKAVGLGRSITASRTAAGKAQAMARHPAGASRSQEFHQQAQAHLNAAQSNQSRLDSMVSPGESGVSAIPGSGPSTAQYN